MSNENLIQLTSLNLPHDEHNDELQKILSGRLKRLGRDKNLATAKQQALYWSAEFFGLHRSQHYLQASVEQQHIILKICNDNLLLESYFIEKLGMLYCAKMVLLANTVETAQAYSLIGADEATHLHWITPYVPKTIRPTLTGKFLNLIAELVKEGDANSLTYLLQILLEGWGLQHYRSLSVHCACLQLKEIFNDILRDEALHHHAGTVLFKASTVNAKQQHFILDGLLALLEMIRVGPQAIVSAVDQTLGGLQKNEKIELINALDGPAIANKKLQLVKKIMQIPGGAQYIDFATAKGYFQAYAPERCVSIYMQ